jgi:oligosaccharide reducing-end xylanase
MSLDVFFGLSRALRGPGTKTLFFRLLFAIAVVSLLAACKSARADGAKSPSGAFATAHYRNLFIENGHSAAKVKHKLNQAFMSLFHGDAATQTVYYPAGSNSNGPLAFINDVKSRDVRSEGMSYGMMIAVQLNKKAEFDSLWNWAKTFMYHAGTNHPAYGYFSWSLQTNGVPNDEMPAPDGEQYFATALYFASSRWGDGVGIYNYRAEADRLVSDMKNRGWITGTTKAGTQTAGAPFDVSRHMVRFTPEAKNSEHTDPSYQLPAFYEVWARCGPKTDRAFWAEAATTSREFFQRTTHPVTGLAPDYANFDGSPWAAPWTPQSANFRYDSWRTAMNWSVDWAWWANDPREQTLSDRLQAFFESQAMTSYANQYTLDGKPLSKDRSTGLVAMNAVTSLAATQPRSRKFVEALWETPVPTGQYRYYDGMLYLLAFLHCSGEFRIWLPK